MALPYDKTYLACLTPAAASAIATLTLHGPRAWQILEAVFQPASNDEPRDFFARIRQQGQPGQFWLGRLGEAGAGSDEVVLALKSREPMPSFEIHCHGGLQVIALLEECLLARGAEKCSWQQWRQHFSSDPIKVLAQEALSQAATLRTANILLHQYHGVFSKTIDEICAGLEQQPPAALAKLEDLARWIPLGRHLTTPWRVVVAGAPNVGKSSLINRLAGYQRAVVSPMPGTTRDRVATMIALDGWPIELTDTAGIRRQAEELERAGIDLALEAMRAADLCLWLVEASAEPIWPVQDLPNQITLINKIDLPPAWNLDEVGGALRISAQTGAGIDNLCQVIVKRLVPEKPAAGTAVPFTPSLCERVEEALRSCRRGDFAAAVHTLKNLS